MTERAIKVVLEIIWDDQEKLDHPTGWDWGFLVNPARLVDVKVIDRVGEGWPSEIH